VAPRDPERGYPGTPDDVPLDADWPDLDAAGHRFRADQATLREVGSRLLHQLDAYQRGRGSPGSLTGAVPPAGAWGGWEPAAPVRDAAEQAMRHLLAAYRRLLRDYEAAGHLLLRTARNYAEADASTGAAARQCGDPTAGRW